MSHPWNFLYANTNSQNRDSPCCVQVFQILLTETAGLTVAGNSTLLAYILFCVLVKFQRDSIVVEFLLGD